MPTIVGSRSGAKPMCKRFADDLLLFAREHFQVVEPEGVSAHQREGGSGPSGGGRDLFISPPFLAEVSHHQKSEMAK